MTKIYILLGIIFVAYKCFFGRRLPLNGKNVLVAPVMIGALAYPNQ